MSNHHDLQERFAGALSRLDGDIRLLREMAAITSEDLPEVTSAVDQAMAQGDNDQAARSLHRLKGMLSTFDSEGVTLHIQETLQLARSGDTQEMRHHYRQHQQELEQLIQQIGELVPDKA